MSANVELKYEIQCKVRSIKEGCRCIFTQKPEDDWCSLNCQLIIPAVNDIRRKHREMREW